MNEKLEFSGHEIASLKAEVQMLKQSCPKYQAIKASPNYNFEEIIIHNFTMRTQMIIPTPSNCQKQGKSANITPKIGFHWCTNSSQAIRLDGARCFKKR